MMETCPLHTIAPPSALPPSRTLQGFPSTAACSPDEPVDWPTAIHAGGCFGAWLVCSRHRIRRGGLYSLASDFAALRDIADQGQARLAGRPPFSIRRAEQLGDPSERGKLF